MLHQVTKGFILCTPSIVNYYYYRVPLLQALIGLFELPEDDSIPDDEHFIEIEDTPGMKFTIRSASSPRVVPWSNVVQNGMDAACCLLSIKPTPLFLCTLPIKFTNTRGQYDEAVM